MGHLGSKKYNSYKGEHRAELISIIRNEHQVIVKYNFFKRDVLRCKRLDLILNVKNNKNEKDKGNGKKEGL
jgi:hypothetical protein